MLTQCCAKSLLDFNLKYFILDVNNSFTITPERLYAPKKTERKKKKKEKKKTKKTKTGQSLKEIVTKMVMLTQCCA